MQKPTKLFERNITRQSTSLKPYFLSNVMELDIISTIMKFKRISKN
jgi:hypothetical protein